MGVPESHPDEHEGPQISLKLPFAPSNSDVGEGDTADLSGPLHELQAISFPQFVYEVR